MSTQTITSTNNLEKLSSSVKDQYTLWQILGIWASVALPMGFNYWVIMPILLSRVSVNPFTYLFLMITGLVWQSILAYLILKREVKPFTWENLKDRLWLHMPTNPKTGIRSGRLFLWMIPLVLSKEVYYRFGLLGELDNLWVKAFPFLAPPPYALIQNLAEPAVGQWWLLGLLAVLIVFNYLLGEELIFRGILLPKMSGVFGKWDVIANGILFTTYHMHMPWSWPSNLPVDWIYAWVAKRHKSYWMAVVFHGIDAVFLAFMFIMAIIGLV